MEKASLDQALTVTIMQLKNAFKLAGFDYLAAIAVLPKTVRFLHYYLAIDYDILRTAA